MSPSGDIDVARLEVCFNQLLKPLLPFVKDPVVCSGMHSLKNLIARLKEDSADKATTHSFEENLCQVRECFHTMAGAQGRFNPKVSVIIAGVLGLLAPQPAKMAIGQDGLLENIFKDDESAGWSPLTVSHDQLIREISKAQNSQKVLGQKASGRLTVKTQENSEDSWSPINSPFSVDLSPIMKNSSSSNYSSSASTPVETPRQESTHFIPINVTVTPATPTSGRGSVTYCENRFGVGYAFWRPENSY